MFKVGITGGIGSGKSTVCGYMEKMFAVPVYYADFHAKRIMVEDKDVSDKIRRLFGEEAYVDGVLNRKYIASVVFRNPEMLSGLNEVVHHAVMEDFRRWVSVQSAPYVVCEAAILIESGWSSEMDLVVVIEAPFEERIRRVANRDGATREEIVARISAQMNDAERRKYADIVVVTDACGLDKRVVTELHGKIISFAASCRSF